MSFSLPECWGAAQKWGGCRCERVGWKGGEGGGHVGSNMRHVLPNSELMRSVFYKRHGENGACNLFLHLGVFSGFLHLSSGSMYEKNV